MGGFAWVTLATNDSYSLGALVLAHSLKQVQTGHQLAVLVTPGVTNPMRAKLASVFNVVQEVNVLDSRDEANLRLLKRPDLGVTFTKLHCWRLTQFEKCVFLDADTLVLQNCDELFDREELSAAPDVGWPDCFNSGVFVYRPSNETYEKLVQFALEKGTFDGGDQGLLNLYFSDWAHKDISKHLPFIYNMCSTACYSYLPAFKQFGADAKIFHFIADTKPWLQYFDTETKKVHPSEGAEHLGKILQQWWDIFCSLIHPQLSSDMAPSSSVLHTNPSFHHYTPITPPPLENVAHNVWDPWEEYDNRQSVNPDPVPYYPSPAIHHSYVETKPIESHNTNACTDVYHFTPPPLQQQQQQQQSFETKTDYSPPDVQSYYAPPPPEVRSHYVPPPTEVQPHYTAPPQVQPHYSPPPFQVHSHPMPSTPEVSHHYEPPPPPTEVHSHHTPIPEIHSHYVETHSYHTPQNDSYNSNIVPEKHSQTNETNNNPVIVDYVPKNTEPPSPVLTSDCEAKETANHQDENDAGIAGAFAQLTLGAPRTAEQAALDDHLRRQGWEVGNIDYLGRDSFENIWSKICETLSTAPKPEASTLTEPPKTVEKTVVGAGEQPPSPPATEVQESAPVPVSQTEPTQLSPVPTEATPPAAAASAPVALEPVTAPVEAPVVESAPAAPAESAPSQPVPTEAVSSAPITDSPAPADIPSQTPVAAESVSPAPTPISAAPPSVPESPAAVPESPAAVPESPTTAPETPAAVPESPTTAPESVAPAPASPAPLPESPTPAPASIAPAPSSPAPATPAPESPATIPAPESAVVTPASPTPPPSSPAPVSAAPAPERPAPVSAAPVPESPAPVSAAPASEILPPLSAAPAPESPTPASAAPVSESPAPVSAAPAPESPAPVSAAPVPSSPAPVSAVPAPESLALVSAAPASESKAPVPASPPPTPASPLPAPASETPAPASPLSAPTVTPATPPIVTPAPESPEAAACPIKQPRAGQPPKECPLPTKAPQEKKASPKPEPVEQKKTSPKAESVTAPTKSTPKTSSKPESASEAKKEEPKPTASSEEQAPTPPPRKGSGDKKKNVKPKK